jgi:GTPase SAR1 family protein
LYDAPEAVIVVGNPGMGKSTLLNQLCRAAVFQSGEGSGSGSGGCTTESQWCMVAAAGGWPTLHLCDKTRPQGPQLVQGGRARVQAERAPALRHEGERPQGGTRRRRNHHRTSGCSKTNNEIQLKFNLEIQRGGG